MFWETDAFSIPTRILRMWSVCGESVTDLRSCWVKIFWIPKMPRSSGCVKWLEHELISQNAEVSVNSWYFVCILADNVQAFCCRERRVMFRVCMPIDMHFQQLPLKMLNGNFDQQFVNPTILMEQLLSFFWYVHFFVIFEWFLTDRGSKVYLSFVFIVYGTTFSQLEQLFHTPLLVNLSKPFNFL